MRYAYFEPDIEIGITAEDAAAGYHQGRCDEDVAELTAVPYIAEQLARLSVTRVVAALRPYGAWDASELANHSVNLQRIVWLACGDIVDNPEE